MQNPKSKIFSRIGAVIIIGGFLAYWQFFSAPGTSNTTPVFFKIENGQNLSVIAENLEQQGLIRSPGTFVLYSKMQGLETAIRSGRYQLTPNLNIKELLAAITDPDQKEIPVTIPEGFSIYDIDKKLAEAGLILPGEFSVKASGMEGFLFPDTYFVFGRNFNPEDLIAKMRQNFLKKITPDLLREIEKQGRELKEIITMASILEREARHDDDYPIVSGILWKRLDSDWPLQADATLLYGKQTLSISQKDLEQESPYNTRKFRGLPPTPIGNPGLKAIRAAIFPQKSAYWFYLSDSEGVMHYSRTNEEHNDNKKKYIR